MSVYNKGKIIAVKCVDKARYVYEHVASYLKSVLTRQNYSLDAPNYTLYVFKCSISL